MGEVGVTCVYHIVEGSMVFICFLDFKNSKRGMHFKLGAYSSRLGGCN